MIKVENVETYGWEAAIRGMRNPKNSWKKGDSVNCVPSEACSVCEDCHTGRCHNGFILGNNDLDLMQRLYKGGTEHRKYLRMITVTMDICAPLYWWKEFDTYKVGTVANSCSTMHKIHDKEFTLDDFSTEHLSKQNENFLQRDIISRLNLARKDFLKAKENGADGFTLKRYWWQMIQLLPSSYNQRRTIQMSYENVMAMIKQRGNHKLDEWREFVGILKELPYVKEISGESEVTGSE